MAEPDLAPVAEAQPAVILDLAAHPVNFSEVAEFALPAMSDRAAEPFSFSAVAPESEPVAESVVAEVTPGEPTTGSVSEALDDSPVDAQPIDVLAASAPKKRLVPALILVAIVIIGLAVWLIAPTATVG